MISLSLCNSAVIPFFSCILTRTQRICHSKWRDDKHLKFVLCFNLQTSIEKKEERKRESVWNTITVDFKKISSIVYIWRWMSVTVKSFMISVLIKKNDNRTESKNICAFIYRTQFCVNTEDVFICCCCFLLFNLRFNRIKVIWKDANSNFLFKICMNIGVQTGADWLT